MDNSQHEPKKNAASIPVWVVIIVIIALAVGIIAGTVGMSIFAKQQMLFTTSSIISFVFTVALGAAAVILAIITIVLSRHAEDALVRRSDEGIKLQQDVFVRTNEVLSTIKASTGVTEKRIEDIISGRVGDISHQIAEIATESKRGGPRSFAEIEEQIRESIMQTLKAEERVTDRQSEYERLQKSRRVREKQYQEQHKQLMNCLCNRDDLKVEKSAHGNYDTSGENLFDGLFHGSDFRLGVSTFREGSDASTICAFLSRASVEISRGTVNLVLGVLFTSDEEGQIPEVEQYLENLKDDMRNRMLVLAIKPNNSEPQIARVEFSNHRIQRTGEAPGASPSADS